MANRKDSKGRVLKHGETERKDGRYVYQYRDPMGKACCVYSQTLDGLREKEKVIQRDLQDGIRSDKGRMTFEALFCEYMNLKKMEVKICSYDGYENLYRSYIKGTWFEKKTIASINNADVKKMLYSLFERGLSQNTVKCVQSLISSTFKYAAVNDYIRKNVATGAMPKNVGKETKAKVPLTEDQVNKLVTFCKSHSIYFKYVPILVIACNTGMRIGELTALTWSRVDLKNKEVRVDRQLRYWKYGDKSEFHISTPKTESGVRTIPLTDAVVSAFRELRKYHMAYGIKCKAEIDGVDDFVFLSNRGNPLCTAGVNHLLKRIEDEYNKHETEKAKEENREAEYLPHISAHILRHTAATILFQKGLSIKAVQGILGHADFEITMSTYNHAEHDTEWIASELQKVGSVVNG